MKILLLVIEMISALGLVATVLLHTAKGEGLGGIGGQAYLFRRGKGLESGLNRATTIFAALFLLMAGILGVFF